DRYRSMRRAMVIEAPRYEVDRASRMERPPLCKPRRVEPDVSEIIRNSRLSGVCGELYSALLTDEGHRRARCDSPRAKHVPAGRASSPAVRSVVPAPSSAERIGAEVGLAEHSATRPFRPLAVGTAVPRLGRADRARGAGRAYRRRQSRSERDVRLEPGR